MIFSLVYVERYTMRYMATQVVILGYGELGKALHHLLRPHTEITVTCWDKNSDILPEQHPLESLIPACDILFVCVPTWTARSALQSIHSLLKPNTIVVSPSKGFEKETCHRVDTLFPQNLPPENPFVFLGGPMIAEEILAGLPAIGVAASASPQARNAVALLFSQTPLVVGQTADVTGTVLAASLKNIYALGLGICDGLALGSNLHGALVAQATHEMIQIISQTGGEAHTALGPAGLGDLVATAQSNNSTNYTTGVRLAHGQKPVRGSEALNTIPCIENVPGVVLSALPFLHAIHNIVVHQNPAREEILGAILAFSAISA